MVERGGGVSGQYPSSGAPLACCCAEVAGEGGAGRREGAAAEGGMDGRRGGGVWVWSPSSAETLRDSVSARLSRER